MQHFIMRLVHARLQSKSFQFNFQKTNYCWKIAHINQCGIKLLFILNALSSLVWLYNRRNNIESNAKNYTSGGIEEYCLKLLGCKLSQKTIFKPE